MSTVTGFQEHTNAASGAEVYRLIEKISPTLDGESRGLVLLAALSLAFIVQDPEIDPEDLMNNVYETSQYVAMLLSRQAGEKLTTN